MKTILILFDSEHEILREEVRSLQEVRSRLTTKLEQIEEENKKHKVSLTH